MGPVPALAGRAPIYIFKQLYGYQKDMRAGVWNPLMKDVVTRLTTDDMIAISAYTASLQP
jgi:cytochrome c553